MIVVAILLLRLPFPLLDERLLGGAILVLAGRLDEDLVLLLLILVLLFVLIRASAHHLHFNCLCRLCRRLALGSRLGFHYTVYSQSLTLTPENWFTAG